MKQVEIPLPILILTMVVMLLQLGVGVHQEVKYDTLKAEAVHNGFAHWTYATNEWNGQIQLNKWVWNTTTNSVPKP